MFLHEISKPNGCRKSKRIVGRGIGSGRGKTCGRGIKGAMSRSGHWIVGGSEGGQMPLIRRIPKMGFRSHRPILYQIVNVERLNEFSKGAIVNAEELKKQGMIDSLNKPVKILGSGDLKKSLTVKVDSISKSAAQKITEAGGKVEAIEQVASAEKKIFDKKEKKQTGKK